MTGLSDHDGRNAHVDGLTAPGLFDGPIDKPCFLAYVEQILVPTLHPGDIVVLDNLKVHQQPEVRAAIEQVGPRSSFCRPTVLISIRSNRSSPN